MTTTLPRLDRPAAAAGRDVRGAAATALVVATVAFVVLASVVLGSAAGQRLDDDAMRTVVAGRETRLAVLSVLGYVSIFTIAIAAVACVLLALARGRIRLALAAVVVIGGANVTTQLLKHGVLERAALAEGAFGPNSLPSGHTTVVASAVGALCLVSPRALRPFVVAAGSFGITLTGASTVVAGWHRPADVVASLLVVLAWTALAALVVGGRHLGVPGTWLLSVLGAAAAMVLLVAIGVRPSYGWAGFTDAALVLGAVTALTAAGVAALNRVTPTA